jgi:hypothetical protein
MAALLIGAEVLLPGWMWEFVQAIRNYHQYTHNESVLSWLLSPLLGTPVAAALVLFSAKLCLPMLKCDAQTSDFGLCLALVLSLSIVVVPMIAPYNEVLLLPPVLLLARYARIFREETPAIRLAFGITAMLLFWPWATTLGLMTASAVLPAHSVQSLWKLPLAPSLLFPLFVFGVTVLLVLKVRTPPVEKVSTS